MFLLGQDIFLWFYDVNRLESLNSVLIVMLILWTLRRVKWTKVKTSRSWSEVLKSSLTFKLVSFKKLQKTFYKTDGLVCAAITGNSHPRADIDDSFRHPIFEFGDAFRKDPISCLSSERKMSFKISLRADPTLPALPVIRISTEKLKELRRQLALLLQNLLMRPLI